MTADSQRRLPERGLLIATAVAAAVLVYLNSLANGFALDDVPIILENPRVHDVGNLHDIWLKPYWPFFGYELGLWRPLAVFGYAVQWRVGGGEPWLFHAVNVVMHAGVTTLAFLLLERLTATRAAFVGALIFAVHPVHTEAVANVVGQAELIGAAALIGACLVHATRPTGLHISWPRRAALLGLFAMGMLAKENTVVLPALLILTDVAQGRVAGTYTAVRQYVRAVAAPFTMLGLAFLFYLTFRFEVLGGTIAGLDAGPSVSFLREEHRVLNALRVLPEMVRLLFFPLQLAADYSPAMILPVDAVTPMVAAGGAMLLAIIFFALLTPKLPAVGFPAAWFLISVITVSNLLFPIGVLLAERTLYLPSFAVSALASYAWFHGMPQASVPARRLVTVATAFAVLAMGARTWVRNPDWSSTFALQSSLVRDHPESYRSQWILATRLWQAGDAASAARHFELAHRLYDRDPQFLTEYGNFRLSHHENEAAVELLEASHRTHPYVPRNTMLLAYAYLGAERYQDALDMTERAEALGAAWMTTFPIRAYAWEGLGDRNRARAAWRATLRHTRMSEWGPWALLGRNLAFSGYDAEALDAIDRARVAAVRDSGASAIVASLEHAVLSGCYRDAASGGNVRALGGRHLTVPACDPLRDWFDSAGAKASAQNANPLQNATEADAAALPAVEGGLP